MMLGRELAETTGERAARRRAAQTTRRLLRASRATARPAMSRRSISSCAAAKWSASPACSAPGRTETARLVFGVERADSGQREGRRRAGAAALAARRRAPRLRLLPRGAQDRRHRRRAHRAREHRAGAAGQARAASGRCRAREQDEIASRYIKLLDIRPPDPERPIGLLSGGNQQKVLLARWLATEPRLLVLDEPTRGIDVGAHAEIIRPDPRAVRRRAGAARASPPSSTRSWPIPTAWSCCATARMSASCTGEADRRRATSSQPSPPMARVSPHEGRRMTRCLPRRGLAADPGAARHPGGRSRRVAADSSTCSLQDGRLFGSLIDVLNRGTPVALLVARHGAGDRDRAASTSRSAR